MKRIIISLIAGICLAIGGRYILKKANNPNTKTELTAPMKKILISKVVEHAALNDTTQGIIDALEQGGYKQGQNLDLRVESAQANAALAAQIASKFANQNPDIVVGVGTISAQSFIQYALSGKVKLIFSTVTDPLSAQLVQSLEKPSNNVSGVSNFVNLAPQLRLFKKLQPNLSRLGILYNPGEGNSVSIVNKLEALCPQFNITLVKQTIAKTSEVAQHATKLAQTVNAIFISNDNTALSALPSVIKSAQAAKIPVYVSDTDAVEQGAVAAIGPNQYEVGQQTGRMIIRILENADINTTPVEFPTKTELFINLAAAQKANIIIPEELLQKAAKVYPQEKS